MSMQNYPVFHSVGRKFYLIAAFILTAMAVQCLYFASDNGQVADETFYNGSGYPMVRYNDYRFLGEHPPLIMQTASLPLLMIQPRFPLQEAKRLADPTLFDLSANGSLFLYKMGNDPYKILFLERCVIILLTLILGFALTRWALELYGPPGAVAALLLYAFCPNIIAHGSLFTTDMGITLFFFLAIDRLNTFFKMPSAQNLLWSGICAGLALLSKISGILLFPISICLFLAAFFFRNPAVCMPSSRKFDRVLLGFAATLAILSLTEKIAAAVLLPLCLLSMVCVKRNRWTGLVSAAGWALSCVLIGLISLKRHWMLVAGLGAWNTFALGCAIMLLRKRKAEAEDLLGFIKAFTFFWFIAAAVIILGYTDFPRSLLRLNPFEHFVRTFNIAFTHILSRHQSCIEGSFVTCDWKYFMAVMAIKIPGLTLAMFAAGLLFFLQNQRLSMPEKLFIVFPPLFFLTAASFLNHINIGLRHVLPVFPFMFLICGSVARKLLEVSSSVLKAALSTCLAGAFAWHIYSTVSILPHSLAYFNEFIPGVEKAGRITNDSNLNWGQDNKRLAVYLKKTGVAAVSGALRFNNPDEFGYHGISFRPMAQDEFIHPGTGIYVLDLEAYAAEQMRAKSWFYGRSPDEKIGKTIYLFNASRP